MNEAGAVHRLDRCSHRLSVGSGLAGQPTQPVGIRRRGGDLDRAALGIEQVYISRWRDRSNPACNIAIGLLVVSSTVATWEIATEEAPLHGIQPSIPDKTPMAGGRHEG